MAGPLLASLLGPLARSLDWRPAVGEVLDWTHRQAAEDRTEAKTAVLQMAAVYGYTFDGPDAIALYLRPLDDLTTAQIVRGCAEALKHERYWPRPATLREHATSAGEGAGASRRTQTTGPRYWQDEQGVTHVEYRCWPCEDTGWVPLLCTPEGDVISRTPLTVGELHEREREAGGRLPTRMRRCACRSTGGAA